MLALLSLLLLAQPLPPLPPQSTWETPAMKEAASLSDSTAAAPADFLTRAEKSGWRETGSYEESVAFYRRLVKSSSFARLLTIGRTAEGRELYALVISKDRAFTPSAAAKTGKAVILIQNGIHPGENGGKDASMMLLRDVLLTKRLAGWLDRVILVSIPVFNADGHERLSPYNRINENGPAEMGFRVTAQRLNLNRDYMKADTPEMRAWLSLYTAWLPDFLIDNHVTDGSDNPYDVTIATHTEQDIAPEVGAWMKSSYVEPLLSRMAGLGHIVGWYAGFGGRGGGAVPVAAFSPRYSTGYAAAQNRAALLVETHSLKSFRTRAWAHYDIMKTTIDIVAAGGRELHAASLAADRRMESMKPGERVFLEGAPGEQSEPYTLRRLETETYESPAAGAAVTRYLPQPVETQVRLVRSLTPKLNPEAPLGYIIPLPWTGLIDTLRRHGVRMETLPEAVTAEFESLRFEDVLFAAAPFEGRFLVQQFQVRPVRETRSLPSGSMFVPVAQRAGKVLMHMLEPEAPDSAVRWGFFQPVFEQKEYFSDYVFAPYADRMLESDPQLQREFEQALSRDPAMAKNARARLNWLYRRSPYYEQEKDAYPVVKVSEKVW